PAAAPAAPAAVAPAAAAAPAAETPAAAATGGRKRKQVQRLEVSVEEKEFEIPVGKGIMLKDMPNVVERMAKETGASIVLKSLHGVLFSRAAKKHEVKKHVLQFSGFVGVDEAVRDKLELKVSKWTLPLLKDVMDLLE
ncbi:unnamed protein product, partial [Phaeothamnion confervicola]